MIANPEKPDSLNMTSFLLSFGIMITAALSIIGWYTTGQYLMLAIPGVIGTVAVITIESFRPNTLKPLYKVWNRMAKKYADFLHFWVLFFSFYLIFGLVSRFGKQKLIKKQMAGSSNWQTNTSLENDTYSTQWKGKSSSFKHKSNWMGQYIGWTARVKNKWMFFLLPHLALLKLSKIEKKEKSSEDIYTLY